jgi:hypothetical protein
MFQADLSFLMHQSSNVITELLVFSITERGLLIIKAMMIFLSKKNLSSKWSLPKMVSPKKWSLPQNGLSQKWRSLKDILS